MGLYFSLLTLLLGHASGATIIRGGDVQHDDMRALTVRGTSITANAFFGDGSHLTGLPSTGSIAGVYVQKAGDFMSGQLTTESTITVKGNAFSVGGSSFTVAGGSATVALNLTALSINAITVTGSDVVATRISSATAFQAGDGTLAGAGVSGAAFGRAADDGDTGMYFVGKSIRFKDTGINSGAIDRTNGVSAGDGASTGHPRLLGVTSGSPSVPHFSFIGDADTGAGRFAANQYYISAGGVSVASFTSTQIITSLSVNLHVRTTATVAGNAFSVGGTTLVVSGGDVSIGGTSSQINSLVNITRPVTTRSSNPGPALAVDSYSYRYDSGVGVVGSEFGGVVIGSPTVSAPGAGNISFQNAGSLRILGVARGTAGGTVSSSSTILMSAGVNHKIDVADAPIDTSGNSLTIHAGNTNNIGEGAAVYGGSIYLDGGNGYDTSGLAGNGGSVIINGGSGGGPSVNGNVLMANVRGNVGISTSAPSFLFTVGGGTLAVSSSGFIIARGPAITGLSGCGTGPALATGSNNNSGKITIGTGGSTACVMTFKGTWPDGRAPACVVTNETTANLFRATSTSTQVTFSGTGGASDVLAYLCLGL